MQTLQFLIDELTRGRRYHISILDMTGILDTPLTKLKFKNVVHLMGFCNIAKSTSRGYRVCQHCKALANAKAASGGVPFGGHCLHGLYEVAHPVTVGGSVCAVIYVGGAVIDKKESERRIESVCRYTGVNPERLSEELEKCEQGATAPELFRIADLVSDYLVWLYNRAPKKRGRQNENTHWLVKLMKHHADEMFRTDITVKELAETCRRNEKYMGRLFKDDMGMSFSEYIQKKRLEYAEAKIVGTEEHIIDIAMDCGFNNISYFNRAFRKVYGDTPTAYRKKMRPVKK